MKGNQIQQLLPTNICPGQLKNKCKQPKEKKLFINTAYSLEFGSDGKTLIQRGPWTQEERNTYLKICQKHEDECLSNQTYQLFQGILQEIPTRNLSQIKGYHNNNNPFQTFIKQKKKIKTNKLEFISDKFLEFVKKNQIKKRLKQQKKLAQFLNQNLTSKSQIVQFNQEDGKQVEIKVFINIDLSLNISQHQDLNKYKDNKLNTTEQLLDQANQMELNQNKIVVIQKNSHEQREDDVQDKEPQMFRKAQQTTFKEIISIIDLESQQSYKKQQSIQKPQQKLGIPQKIKINIQQLQRKEIIQIEQQCDQVEIHQIKEKENKEVQENQQSQISNLQEIRIQNKIHREINNQNSTFIQKKNKNITKLNNDYKIIILDSEDDLNQNPDNFSKFHSTPDKNINRVIKDNNQVYNSQKKGLRNNQIVDKTKVALFDKEKDYKSEMNNLQDINNKSKVNSKLEINSKQNKVSLNNMKDFKEQKQQNNQKINSEQNQEIFINIDKNNQKVKQKQQAQKQIEKETQFEKKQDMETLKHIEKDQVKDVIQEKVKQQRDKVQQDQRQSEKEYYNSIVNQHAKKERNKDLNRDLRTQQGVSGQKNKNEVIQEQNKYKQDSSFQQVQQQQKQQSQQQINVQQTTEIQNQQLSNQNYTIYNQFQGPLFDPIKWQQQQYFIQNQYGLQPFCINGGYFPTQVFDGQYQRWQEVINLKQDMNSQDKTSQFNSFFPMNFQNSSYYDQAIKQPQSYIAYQPPSPQIHSPYYYQLIPFGLPQYQTQGAFDFTQNLNNNQNQGEEMHVYLEARSNFDQNNFYQLTPQSFSSNPGGSQLEDALK